MKVLIVTGSNGGIGSKICEFFKNKEWYVVGLDLHKSSVHQFTDNYYQVDLTKKKDIINFITSIKNVDCFINCAAYQCCKPIWEYEEKEWDDTYNCNVKSIFLFIKYGLPIFKRCKTNIINISSIHAIATSKHISSYASSKAAIVGLTKNMAIDLADFGIRVNSICPGAINTPMLYEHLDEKKITKLKDKHLLKEIGNPIDIAKTCYFINNTIFMNGNNIIIDGGVSSQLSSE